MNRKYAICPWCQGHGCIACNAKGLVNLNARRWVHLQKKKHDFHFRSIGNNSYEAFADRCFLGRLTAFPNLDNLSISCEGIDGQSLIAYSFRDAAIALYDLAAKSYLAPPKKTVPAIDLNDIDQPVVLWEMRSSGKWELVKVVRFEEVKRSLQGGSSSNIPALTLVMPCNIVPRSWAV